MLSRVNRFTTVAQVLSSCQKFKDNNNQRKEQHQQQSSSQSYTTGLTSSSSFSSLYPEPRRQRCPSFKNDPVLGCTEEESILHNLELLDLEGWNTDKNVLAPRSPSPTTLNGDSRNGTNWMDNYVDLSSIELDTSAYKLLPVPPSTPEMVLNDPLELDQLDSQVDLNFWTRYLDGENSSLGFKMDEPIVKQEIDDTIQFASTGAEELMWNSVPHKATKSEVEVKVEMDDLTSSGPLIYIPQQVKEEDLYDSSYTPPRSVRKARRYSEAFMSDSAADDDFDYDEQPVIKKRGVIMKPSVDEETDRKRALNREAAFRYREKKRAEQHGRKREFMKLSEKNRRLRGKERQLASEIAKVRKRLVELGITLN